MARAVSRVAPGWWDYTTLEPELLKDAAGLEEKDIAKLGRPGFRISFYDTLEEFYLAEALEYVDAWQQATPDNPAGICGPIGPTEQLPLVALIVNSLGIKLQYGHFWGMDEWFVNGEPVDVSHPLSFQKADMDLCFDRIDPALSMAAENLHFLTGDLDTYSRSFDDVRCVVMQGGQGEVKHWAFNDPPPREDPYCDSPPPPDEYRKLSARVVLLHPMTIIQNARTSAGGNVSMVPARAVTVGPVETWKAEKVSIWHPGIHDNPFGMRLTTLMISEKIVDTSVPMSLLTDHPDVRFNFYRKGLGTVRPEMH